MAVTFTPDQQATIDARDSSILVSAAAGSGKTAVLVERIIQMVSDAEHPVDIDRLLVVTFTNAAAAQMRERITQALSGRVDANPGNAHLLKQLTLIHNAQITTIDSFCLYIIRNHFDEIDLDPDFRVTEESYTEDAYQLLLRSMREIVAAAEKLGVIVGVEGVFNHTLYSPARMKRFLEDIDSPNVEVILDAVNLIHPEQAEPEAQKEVIDRAFAYYGDRIGALHVKDFVFDGQEQLFRHVGDGLFRYEPLMRHVKERKPHIAMLLENSSRERYHEDVKFLQTIYDRV